MQRRDFILNGLSLAATMALPFAASANAREKLFMVEVAAFACPSCNEVNQHIVMAERSLGDQFIFAPVPYRADQKMELLWYGMRKHKQSIIMRDAMFDMLHKIRMLNYKDSDLIEWIRLQGFDSDVEEMRAAISSAEAKNALRRAIRLAYDANVNSVPSFVYVRDRQVVDQLTRSDQTAAAYVSAGLERFRYLDGDNNA